MSDLTLTSAATGSARIHQAEQEQIVAEALG